MNRDRNALRLNVGFIIGQSIGYSRDFYFEYPSLHLPPDLDLHDLSGVTRITRTPQGLLVQGKMRASTTAQCGRCLTDFDQILDTDFAELYAFSARSVSESGLILPENGYIDLAPLVREYMLLALPITPVCKPDCQGLCPVCGELLAEGAHEHFDEVYDSRLVQLKDLLEGT